MALNLWILTEERPKTGVLRVILEKFAKDNGMGAFMDALRILPVLGNGKFTFTYEITSFICNHINKIFLKTISGYSSFVDFLVFFQEKEPDFSDIPLYAIEETKTDDSESRNTGVYQRCAKFVFLNYYYSSVKKIMLYDLRIKQKSEPTQTNIFGTRLLLTLGVEIIGKKLNPDIFKPFETIDEIINYKLSMRSAPKGNIPISLTKKPEENFFVRDNFSSASGLYAENSDYSIEISGRLLKSNTLSHDPNIGALSVICAALRKLGYSGAITISRHGLSQHHITPRNKFILIANMLNIQLEGLILPKATPNPHYWRYEKEGEKLGTIFIHIVVESFTDGYSIFENHAGCEKGYFITSEGKHIPLEKYADREKYKAGDKDQIAFIPDLILLDFGRSEVINIEGKKYQFRRNGIEELKNYDFIEQNYILKYYPHFKITRTVVLYGSKEKKLIELEIGFLLNEEGDLILGVHAPPLFQDAIKNLLDFWK